MTTCAAKPCNSDATRSPRLDQKDPGNNLNSCPEVSDGVLRLQESPMPSLDSGAESETPQGLRVARRSNRSSLRRSITESTSMEVTSRRPSAPGKPSPSLRQELCLEPPIVQCLFFISLHLACSFLMLTTKGQRDFIAQLLSFYFASRLRAGFQAARRLPTTCRCLQEACPAGPAVKPPHPFSGLYCRFLR